MKIFKMIALVAISTLIFAGYVAGYFDLTTTSSGTCLAMAAPYIDLAGACEKIMKQMSSLQGKNYPMAVGAQIGTIDFITNPAATLGGVKTELISIDQGKKLLKTKVIYKQPTNSCEAFTGSTAINAGLCDTPREDDEKSVEVTIGGKVGIQPRAFSNDRMINICQNTQAFVDEYLMSDIRAMREKLSGAILALILANAGKNYQQNGSTGAAGADVDVKLLANDSFSQPVPLHGNFNKVKMDFANNYMSGIPHLIGQGNLQTYFELSNFACCNATVPYGDAVAKAGSAFYLDQIANSVLGTNKFLSIAAGSTHLLWFNENNNININSDVVKHIVISDPVYPQLKWDLDFKWDECNKKWIYYLSAWYDVFNTFQANSFKKESPVVSPACDHERLGMTGIFYYEATSA